jgi:hypothetical protein
MNTKFKTREEWLEGAVKLMTPHFLTQGFKIPNVHVSVGWPSSRGTSAKQPAIGECWDKSAASDKIAHVFISPRLDEVCDPQGVLSVLVHEIVHATVGNKAGHGKAFRDCALKVGLEGKMTHTEAGEVLVKTLKAWSAELGKFPHGKLNPSLKPTKKQGTRLVKCQCGGCGYVLRTTRKWLEEVGAPLCACNKQPMKFESPDEDGGGDE